MNDAWNLWIISYGMFALTLVSLSMVILHLGENEEERETNSTEWDDS